MSQYVLYLRKSRADLEAEQRGEGETLARHEKDLLALAKKLNLNVIDIYREIVSGETIASRPVMQQLLVEVESGVWDGVLVMEIERLARGDTIDQGIVAQAFKYSNTKIITPTKTFDPNNEFDEEYFEFGLFMSRREYKTINRRLQRGRISSVMEGKYVSSQPPYGYLRKKLDNDKGFTLVPHPEQADIVRMIFEWYTSGDSQPDGTLKRLGVSKIARKLNDLKIKPQKGDAWVVPSIRDIIINPVYIGKIRWNWRPSKKKMIDGKIKKERPRSEDLILVNGLHEPLISEEVFYRAQELIKKNPPAPIQERNTIKNPLAGIVICGKCGRTMIRRPYNDKTKCDMLMCPATHCNNVSVQLDLVETRILNALENYLTEYKIQLESNHTNDNKSKLSIIKKQIKQYENDITDTQKQLDNIYDLLEKGIYTTEQFLERSKIVSERINDLKNGREELLDELKTTIPESDGTKYIVPKIEHLLDVYRKLPTAQAKNDLLKEVLVDVIYLKEKSAKYKGVSPDDFSLKFNLVLH